MPRRALVVDDEPAMCELLKTILSSNGMEPLILPRSVDAPGHLQDEKFDVVFLGFHMPPPDGIELTQQIRRSGFNKMTPIVILSADQDPAALARGFHAGASFFIYKPVDKTHLLRLVRATQGAVEHERRRFRRVPLQSRVQLKFEEGEFECETVDISLNGMLVSAPFTFPRGSSAMLRLHLTPGMKPVVGSGSVMRVVGENQMGIQFDDLSGDESRRLQEHLLPMILSD
ncbi:MAG TPA: response regulator [Acidobacteriota bacterium]|nr:response regulator [Acidobacteriota bacterium]